MLLLLLVTWSAYPTHNTREVRRIFPIENQTLKKARKMKNYAIIISGGTSVRALTRMFVQTVRFESREYATRGHSKQAETHL